MGDYRGRTTLIEDLGGQEHIVENGGLTKAGDLIMKPIQKAYDEHVLRTFKGKAKFLVSTLDGSSAAVLGASAVAWDM